MHSVEFTLTQEDHLPGDRVVIHFDGGYDGNAIITQVKGDDLLEEARVPVWVLKEFVADAIRADLTRTLEVMDPETLLARVVSVHQGVWLQGYRSCRERGNSLQTSTEEADKFLAIFKKRFDL